MNQFVLFDDAPVHLNPKGKTARKQAAQAAITPLFQEAVAAVADVPKKVNVTRSTGEAMALLKRSRKQYIESAREVASGLITKHGTTHIFAVRDVMSARNMLRPDLYKGEFWLGAVFRCSTFRKTGAMHVDPPSQRNKTRNIHSNRETFVWTFA